MSVMGAIARAACVAALAVLPPAAALRLLPPAEPADLVFVSGPEPESLDPAVASRVVDLRLVSALFEPLVALDPETLEARGAAAATWTADARGATFTLAEGLRWSNGDPLGPEDFLYAWRRAAEPATGAPFATEAAEIAEGARALDGRTIRVEPRRPRPDLVPLLSLPAFAPVHRASVERLGERFTRPGNLVSNGPFALAAWEPGRRLRLARNPRFHRAVDLASIEAITTSGGVAGGDTTAFQIYETGGADLCFAPPERAALGHPDLVERPGAGTYFLRFNTTRAPLATAGSRRRLAAAMDRAAICKYVLQGANPPAETLVPAELWQAPVRAEFAESAEHAETHREAPPGSVSSDSSGPGRHSANSADSANSARTHLSLLYPASDDAAARIGEVLQQAWKPLGVDLRLVPMEPKAAFAAVKRLEYDVAWSNWIADYPDPVSFLDCFRSGSGNNRTGWTDAAYDAALERAAGEAGGARLATLRAAERRLLEEAPIAPLFRTTASLLARRTLRGAVAVPFQHAFPWASLRREGAPP
ncbi:MAG TPA: peptide ABC transporter substrate-binding protein [Planctomycetota bacterium]|nr:peptide ABC transporter substrate-binding protein [Planctomycetota bacterium]